MYKFFAATSARFNRYLSLTILGIASAFIFTFASASTATAATVVVDVGGTSDVFTPASVDITVGDTVMWVWQSDGHSVRQGDTFNAPNPLFDSTVQDQPFTFSYTFTDPGTVNYYCQPHFFMGMVGTVNVAAAAPKPALLNISTRGFVGIGDSVMIAGFILAGEGDSSNVVVRAIGPALGLDGALADPTLELHDINGAIVASNDNWQDAANSGDIPANLQPTNALESAVLAALPAGAYTAIVAGKDGTSGIGLVEVYNLQ
ncbi:MAG: plastocyanin/azurin family copper-binding protein [Chthoniobacterales bacterium]